MDTRPSRHHLLFPRQEWEMRPESRRVRQTHSMIPLITRADHDYLHETVPLVPLLGHNTLKSLPGLWTPRGETFGDIDSLCRAIDKASAPHRVQEIERDLAGLTIEALLMQRQVLREVRISL